MNVLVTGGAGYIGSACVHDLCDYGHNVLVIDNLSTGNSNKVDSRVELMEVDIMQRDSFFRSLDGGSFDAVLHFAAHKDAGASMKNAPMYSQNITGMVNVLDACVQFNIPKIVFSSTAAIYGEPANVPVTEKHATHPINYYGGTKLICEDLLEWYKKIHGISYCSLRYFNVAGDHGLKYIDNHAKNLFPIIVDVIQGRRDYLEIYGNDYPTRDGTCIRDYIHLSDLVSAHMLALDYAGSDSFNLGTEHGQTVLEIVHAFEKALGNTIPTKIVSRRDGDPSELISSSKKARDMLGWNAHHTLEDIVRSTLDACSM